MGEIEYITSHRGAITQKGPNKYEIDARAIDDGVDDESKGPVTVGSKTVGVLRTTSDNLTFRLRPTQPEPTVRIGDYPVARIRNPSVPLFDPGSTVGNPSNVEVRNGEIVSGPPSGQEVTLKSGGDLPTVRFGEVPGYSEPEPIDRDLGPYADLTTEDQDDGGSGSTTQASSTSSGSTTEPSSGGGSTGPITVAGFSLSQKEATLGLVALAALVLWYL